MRKITYSIYDPETWERFPSEEYIASNNLDDIYSYIDSYASEKNRLR